MDLLLFLLSALPGVGIGYVVGRAARLRRSAAEPDGCPTVVEVDGVWWVYLPGQGWVDATNPPAATHYVGNDATQRILETLTRPKVAQTKDEGL